MTEQVIQKTHHTVLASEIFIDAFRELIKISANKKTWIGFNIVFADKYYDLKITQKTSTGHTGYHSVNAVVPTRYIISTLDNLTLAVTADQSHVEHLTKKIRHLMDMNNILGYHIKQPVETNEIPVS